MTDLQSYLRDISLVSEFISATVAFLYFKNVKNTHWKWFSLYLIFIFIFEIISYFGLEKNNTFRKYYYDFLIIPFQFVFLYWLYAYKSLNRKQLFKIILLLYLLMFIITHVFEIEKTRIINMLSYSFGVLLLFILVILEFFKQIKSDNILQFKESKMFYINFGVALFYIGTLPFFAFDGFSYEHTKNIWEAYWTIFLSLNILMYLLFSASFIWGKVRI